MSSVYCLLDLKVYLFNTYESVGARAQVRKMVECTEMTRKVEELGMERDTDRAAHYTCVQASKCSSKTENPKNG